MRRPWWLRIEFRIPPLFFKQHAALKKHPRPPLSSVDQAAKQPAAGARRSHGSQGQAEEGAPLGPRPMLSPPPSTAAAAAASLTTCCTATAPCPHPALVNLQKKESTEARKARLDMEALAAAEAEAARQADARRALRERAERQAALTAVNARKLDAEWLQRMRSAKLEELRDEARVLSKDHDAQADRRDRLIEVRTQLGAWCWLLQRHRAVQRSAANNRCGRLLRVLRVLTQSP